MAASRRWDGRSIKSAHPLTSFVVSFDESDHRLDDYQRKLYLHWHCRQVCLTDWLTYWVESDMDDLLFSQQSSRVESLIRKEISSRNIEVLFNKKLLSIDNSARKLLLSSHDTHTTTTIAYDSLYCLPPTSPYSILTQSGLADSTGKLLLDANTLIHQQ